MPERTRVLLLVRALEGGGAERQLVNLARHIDRDEYEPAILTFYDEIRLPDDLPVDGLTVFSLHKSGRWDVFAFVSGYLAALRRWRPDVVHSFMEAANLLTLAGRLPGRRHRIVWGMRRSGMDDAAYDWTRRVLYRLEARFARFADLVVANSHAGRRDFVGRGGPAERTVVVPNGIDIGRLQRDEEGRARFRAELGVGSEVRLIGMVARHDPKKDHPTFLRAAARLAEGRRDVHFALVGRAVGDSGQRLRALARELGIEGIVSFVDQRADMSAVLSAFDIATLSSAYGEGFPNVVAEAMAAGTPVVATDVGDSAVIVDSCGEVVPPCDPGLLAAAWGRVLDMPDAERAKRAAAAAQRIEGHFSVDRMVMEMQRVYRAVMAGERPAAQPEAEERAG